jgi:DnaJ-class molecular chaperone
MSGFWRRLFSGKPFNACDECEGSGWAVKTHEEKRVCPACGGAGNKDRDWRQTGGGGGGAM